MKKKVGIVDRITFISNTLGSFMLAVYFGDLKSVIGYLLGIYCLLNMLCYLLVASDIYKGNDEE